ncbi:HIRAN domain-containing protein [Novosphingobium resinovorum]|uniref:HIRAN domain-containing protein n=2 Tax=Novosphingobium TaxID=165696 RepID=UPI0025A02766|nr:HIRAN domain-containing protein [Novosphingobium resinovorum]WJM28580.1 HIRAN domain-containing protein [Novosphingobium resinovorum]
MTSIPAMSLAVVGAPHPNADGSNRQFEILLCEPGEPVRLVPEPKNKHDRHAIAVLSVRDVQLGYISAERAPRVGGLLGAADVQAVFQRKADFGAWIRVSFDGEIPKLTNSMLVEAEEIFDEPVSEPDFYPDEIWPDD